VQCLWVETVLEPACPGSIAAEPAPGPQGGEQLVPRVIVVLYDAAGLMPTPGQKVSSMNGSSHPIFFSAILTTLFPVLSSGIAISHSDTTRQNALYGAMVEVHKPLCAYATFSEAP